jgi:hypothetical protein
MANKQNNDQTENGVNEHHLVGDITQGVAGWLEIDVDAIEDQLLETVKEVANPATVELNQLQAELQASSVRVLLAGEDAHSGDWICCDCNKHFYLEAATTLKECLMCDSTRFRSLKEIDEGERH